MSDADTDVNLALLRKLRVDQVARWLEIHPFEVLRVLVSADRLPPDLRLDANDVERVRELARLETWWDGAGVPLSDAELVVELAKHLLARLPATTSHTRADNIFRGLDGHRQIFLRRVVNRLARMGYLDIVMTASGLTVSLRAENRPALSALAAGPGAVEDLVRQSLVDGTSG